MKLLQPRVAAILGFSMSVNCGRYGILGAGLVIGGSPE